MSAAATAKGPGVPQGIRGHLAMLRESYMHAAGYQDGLAVWWDRIGIEERRLLLAFVGLDESEENARRPWRQYLQEHRDQLVAECKHFARIVEGLKWF